MKSNITVSIDDGGKPCVEKECPFCGSMFFAYPRAVLTDTTWSDYDGMRTNRITVEFESVHVCGGRG